MSFENQKIDVHCKPIHRLLPSWIRSGRGLTWQWPNESGNTWELVFNVSLHNKDAQSSVQLHKNGELVAKSEVITPFSALPYVSWTFTGDQVNISWKTNQSCCHMTVCEEDGRILAVVRQGMRHLDVVCRRSMKQHLPLLIAMILHHKHDPSSSSAS